MNAIQLEKRRQACTCCWLKVIKRKTLIHVHMWPGDFFLGRWVKDFWFLFFFEWAENNRHAAKGF
ncbi:hypothetical protein HanRHA438_Chr16g0778381 [Helianthus annuus]|nr:hypothetical protein HanRHA438_Chr16g0778381 [Helianthus annuus]